MTLSRVPATGPSGALQAGLFAPRNTPATANSTAIVLLRHHGRSCEWAGRLIAVETAGSRMLCRSRGDWRWFCVFKRWKAAVRLARKALAPLFLIGPTPKRWPRHQRYLLEKTAYHRQHMNVTLASQGIHIVPSSSSMRGMKRLRPEGISREVSPYHTRGRRLIGWELSHALSVDRLEPSDDVVDCGRRSPPSNGLPLLPRGSAFIVCE